MGQGGSKRGTGQGERQGREWSVPLLKSIHKEGLAIQQEVNFTMP